MDTPTWTVAMDFAEGDTIEVRVSQASFSFFVHIMDHETPLLPLSVFSFARAYVCMDGWVNE